MKKKYINLILALVFTGILFFSTVSAAFESQYPKVFNYEIKFGSNFPDYVVYFYAFFVALGGVIAFLVLISAGIDFITSSGSPSKISGAKNKFFGAFFGLTILLFSYFILNTINDRITGPAGSDVSCDKNMDTLAVCVDYIEELSDGTKKVDSVTAISSNPNLNLKPNQSIKIRKYANAKEVWLFPEPDYKGVPMKIFKAEIADESQSDMVKYLTQIKDLEITSTHMGVPVKSFKIVAAQEGFYLYDKIDFGVTDGTVAPLFLNKNVADLSVFNFDKKAQSINKLYPRWGSESIMPLMIAFSETNYRGICVPITEFSGCGDLSKKKLSGPNLYFGNNNLSSLIVFNYIENNNYKGKVIFYDVLNCGRYENDHPCEIEIGKNRNPETVVKNICGNGFDIKSFKIDGQAGVVLRASSSYRCQYWDLNSIKSGGSCVSDITQSDVYNPDVEGVRPDLIMVFPVTNE
ncbi:MAG: hypothetical protein WC520_03790 [Candidatus Paceibacterota bacterium]